MLYLFKNKILVFLGGVIFLFFILIQPASAADITSTQSGDWSDTNTWVGGAVPGDGDVAYIADTHTVVVDTNTTIGPSGTSTELAVFLNSTGKVVVATGTTFTVRGSVSYTSGSSKTTDGIVIGAGAIWEWDASAATTPTSTHYQYFGNSCWQYRGFRVNGLSGNRATVRSNADGGAGIFTISNSCAAYGLNFQATYTDFSRIGDANNKGWLGWFYGNDNSTGWNVSYSTFDNCGSIYYYGAGSVPGGATISHTYNTHTNTLGNYVLNFSVTTAISGGTRDIVRNIFDKAVGEADLQYDDFDITNNYFGDGFYSIANTDWNKFDSNFWLKTSADSYDSARGTYTNNLLFGGVDINNPHWMSIEGSLSQVYVIGNIFEHAGNNSTDGGDIILTLSASVSSTVHVEDNIVVPGLGGRTPGTLMTIFGSVTNRHYNIAHNTVYLDSMGIVDFETGIPVAGSLSYLKSNIVWAEAANSSSVYKTQDFTSGATTDVADPSNLDYNVGWNYSKDVFPVCAGCSNRANGYDGDWSSEPTAPNDIDANPEFTDDTRNVVTWDSVYLGNSATSWDSYASDDSFATGTMVSNTDANVYGGVVINYRSIKTHTKGTSNSEPGIGSSWHTYWEFASLYRIREGIINGTTYSPDSANGLSTASTTMPTLMSWIRTGFTPTNPALKNTPNTSTWDGRDLGAMSVVDIYAPTITIVTPSADEDINSTYSITASSTDWFDVAGVKFYYNTSTLIGSEVTSTSSPDVYSVSWDTTALADGSYNVLAVARDSAGNQATSSIVSFTITNDSTAPVRSGGSPSGSLSSGTTSTTISLATDESATCKYSTTAGTAYASMTSFSTTGGTSHSSAITVSAGNSYAYYVKCADGFSNTNSTDYTISFSVAAVVTGGAGLPAQAFVPPAPPSGSNSFSADVQTISTSQTSDDGLAAIFGRATLSLVTEVGADSVKMSVSNNPDFKGATIEPYQKEKEWNVCWKSAVLQYPSECSSGEYTVYIKFYTIWGQASEPLAITVNHDAAAQVTNQDNLESDKKNEVVSRFIFNKDLVFGNNNDDVKELQKRLKDEALFDYPIFTTYFGPVTFAAVKGYQTKYSISPVNGTVGPTTRAVLNGYQKDEVKNTEKYIFDNDLEFGMRDEEVMELQKRLKDEGVFNYPIFTEYFGPVTLQAVKDYQEKYGITPVNGRVGPLTRSMLNK